MPDYPDISKCQAFKDVNVRSLNKNYLFVAERKDRSLEAFFQKQR